MGAVSIFAFVIQLTFLFISKKNQYFWEIYIAKWSFVYGGESCGLVGQKEKKRKKKKKEKKKKIKKRRKEKKEKKKETWKCKDSLTKPWKFRVYFMIILVNEKFESVRIQ